jgi:hypothetical protein
MASDGSSSILDSELAYRAIRYAVEPFLGDRPVI